MRNNGHIFSCNMDAVVHRVEWVTLIFFGSMFITMECLSKLGLITWIGKQTEYLILLSEERFRLFLAIIIILWVKIVYSKVLETYLILFTRNVQFSALSSSVVDSTPVTAMMVKVLDSFAQNKGLNLPIKPIVSALAFGPTLGGLSLLISIIHKLGNLNIQNLFYYFLQTFYILYF